MSHEVSYIFSSVFRDALIPPHNSNTLLLESFKPPEGITTNKTKQTNPTSPNLLPSKREMLNGYRKYRR